MKDLKFVDVDYCRYGLSVRKRTRIWMGSDTNLELKMCKQNCEHVIQGSKKRKIHAVSWNSFGKGKACERAIIPHNLCVSIVEQVKYFLKIKLL